GEGARRDEITRQLGDARKRPADAIEPRAEKTRSELCRERDAERLHGFAGGEACGVLIDLERRDVAALANDLPEHSALADRGHFVQRRPERRGLDERAGDACDDRGHCSRTRYPIARRSSSTM